MATWQEPIVLNRVRLPGGGSFPAERHPWGQFVYCVAGVIELTVTRHRYAAPPDFGVWLPPQTDHLAWAGDRSVYLVLDVDHSLCSRLPGAATIIAVGPIAKAILLDLDRRGLDVPRTAEDSRLMRVLVDQLSGGASLDQFLPLSDDRALRRVLDELCEHPEDNRSLLEWAAHVHTTDRTLARRCQRDLGMSFAKWRQRLRLTRAMTMLSQGLPVQSIAKALGYSTTSAFIVMFQGAIGVTPSVFREGAGDSGMAPPQVGSKRPEADT